jgi:hypothetical protein
MRVSHDAYSGVGVAECTRKNVGSQVEDHPDEIEYRNTCELLGGTDNVEAYCCAFRALANNNSSTQSDAYALG